MSEYSSYPMRLFGILNMKMIMIPTPMLGYYHRTFNPLFYEMDIGAVRIGDMKINDVDILFSIFDKYPYYHKKAQYLIDPPQTER